MKTKNDEPQPNYKQGILRNGNPPEPGAPTVCVTMFFPAAMAAPGDVFRTYMHMAAEVLNQPGWGILSQARSGAMDCARTVAAQIALKEGFTHILMLDCDHIHHPALPQRLLSHQVPVVGGLNYKRSPPHEPCAAVEITPNPDGITSTQTFPKRGDGLVEVQAVGSGCLMIELAAIKDLPLPWFYMPYDCMNFESASMLAAGWPGEDGGFCKLCHDHGVKMYCDTGATSPHLGNLWVGGVEK